MGSPFKSKTSVTKAPFESNPWEKQQPYLTAGFSSAQDALAAGQGALGGISDYTADMTSGQIGDIAAMQDLGRDAYGNVSTAGMTAGMSTVGNFSQAGQNYNALYGQAGVDPTQGIISNAQAYASDPYLTGQIDAALGDVRKAFDQNVAGINSTASGTGNINSTRAGALEALAMDDAMDRGAAISSQMRGQAYQAGLDRAMTTQQTQFDNQFRANAALEGNGASGFGMAADAASVGMEGLRGSYESGSLLQQQQQAEIQGKLTAAGMPLDLVKQYMAAVGGNYGSQGYQSQVSQSPSLFQTLAGAAATYAGAGGTFCWVAREVYGEDDPRWEKFRFWMFTAAPIWFFRAYAKHGEKIALFIRRHPWLKCFIRPLMNLAIK